MKIVITIFGSVLHVGGIPVSIFELANALIRAGHVVYLISGREVQKPHTYIREMFDTERLPKIITLQGINEEVFSARLTRGTIKELLLWLYQGSRLLKKIKPDMIILNGAVPLLSPAFKVIVCHDLEFSQKTWNFMQYFLKLYDRILYQTFDMVAATSTELSRMVSVELGIKSNRVVTIPICIDTQKYSALPQERREHAILHVGTWVDKNLETTVKIFCKLAKIDPAIRLYVVGNLWKRPKVLLSKVPKKFLKRIHCVGHISKMKLRHLYSRVKVTSVPSTYRVPVLSPTVLESLAAGTPVVGGSLAISRDLLKDGYNGFRVATTDFKEQYERISMLTTDNKLWVKLSANARSIAENFDASIVAKKYIKLSARENENKLV